MPKRKIKHSTIRGLFPNYKISKEELNWCINYQERTGFEVINTDEVIDKASFLDMCEYNINWIQDYCDEMKASAERAMRELSYYDEILYA